MTTWIKDSNGNKCSVEYFGSKEAAKEALASLKNCKNCINCSRCSRCSRCSYCSDCSGCSYCSRCSYCSCCSRCSRCSCCSYCSDLKADKKSENQNGAPAIPVIADIHKAVYAAATATPESLDMSTWHRCETTHCRAGWVVHLAGEEGKALEAFHNTELAARLIYKASGYEINPAQFYLDNESAMRDMKALAEG